MHRTFPAHEFFKEEGGVGQDALYKLNKAYSVYDAEVGYCQGNRACIQQAHNAIFHWNFQKYSVKVIYAIIDSVCLGYPK